MKKQFEYFTYKLNVFILRFPNAKYWPQLCIYMVLAYNEIL